jgi:hypothetical protein
MMKIPRKPFPPGAVRECQQFSIDPPDVYRWDFAWRDPASGKVWQYSTQAMVMPGMSEADFAEQVRAPAIACLERQVHRKCGMDYAMKNQYPLELPRNVPGRFV